MRGRRAGHLGGGPEVPVRPPGGRVEASLGAHHAGAAEPELVGDAADLLVLVGVLGGVEVVVQARVGRDEAVVVVVDGQQVAGREVLRADPLVPRDPLGRHDGAGTGQQRDLADGDGGVRVVVGHHDRDRPGPAAVAGLVGREVVGGRGDRRPVPTVGAVLGVHREGVADLVRLALGRVDRRRAREVDRLGQARRDGTLPVLGVVVAQVGARGGVGEVVHVTDSARRGRVLDGCGRAGVVPGRRAGRCSGSRHRCGAHRAAEPARRSRWTRAWRTHSAGRRTVRRHIDAPRTHRCGGAVDGRRAHMIDVGGADRSVYAPGVHAVLDHGRRVRAGPPRERRTPCAPRVGPPRTLPDLRGVCA